MAYWIPASFKTVCPYCGRHVLLTNTGQHGINVGYVATARCPACSKPVVDLIVEDEKHAVWPDSRTIPLPPEVPQEVTRDWNEAIAVSPKSSRAAAVLARRALQITLRKAGFEAATLYKEIEKATASADTPSTLREKLHAVRDIGNAAAHPNEDPAGALVEVTEDEVEFLFEALQEAFDVYFVRPERHRKIMEARTKPRADG
jgi:endogenous inhibitor of DNA gyrase (YacG/DUF329 family)